MPLTHDDVREFALSLPQAEEKSHFDKADFRVNNKIFATLPAPDKFVFKATLEDQGLLTDMFPDIFSLAGWAHQGWTQANLMAIPRAQMEDVLFAAWRNVAPKRVSKAYNPP